MLVLGRIAPLFLLAPVFSSTIVPQRVKFIAAAGISIALTPLAAHGRTIPTDPLVFGLTLTQEVGIGIAFALALGALAAAVTAGAGLLDTLVGFSFGALVDPMTGNQNAILGAGLLALRDDDLRRLRRDRPDDRGPRPDLLADPARHVSDHERARCAGAPQRRAGAVDRAGARRARSARGDRRGCRLRHRGPRRPADERAHPRPADQGLALVRRDRRLAAVCRPAPRGRHDEHSLELARRRLPTRWHRQAQSAPRKQHRNDGTSSATKDVSRSRWRSTRPRC